MTIEEKDSYYCSDCVYNITYGSKCAQLDTCEGCPLSTSDPNSCRCTEFLDNKNAVECKYKVKEVKK